MNIKPVDTQTGSTSISTSALNAPTLATAITNQVGGVTYGISTAAGGTAFASALDATLPVAAISDPNPAAVTFFAEYAVPYSSTLPGYSYQTFGSWASTDATNGVINEYYFSAGAPTMTPLPVSGTASYTGYAMGSFVDATTRDPASITAIMNATADFAKLSVAFSTTATLTLSGNAGTLLTQNPGLNMSGTLTYAAGSNTFTGAVTTTNGMTGNATGRFYGPGIATATATKVAGAPPEIGGTFAVSGSAGAMQGAFGGN